VKYAYYPGCTLETKAVGFNRSILQVSRALGVELVELADWNCCGATFPLCVDNLLDLAGPARNLVSAAEAGAAQLIVACATCFNVLSRTRHFLATHPDELDRLNAFLERPQPYAGGVAVRHLLDVLRADVGFDAIKARAHPGLGGLRVAAYYGCMLLRPADEIGLDDPERPRIMDDLFAALGADMVEYPHRGECCGAYVTVRDPIAAAEISYRILAAAGRAGAELIVTACPLCQFNLDWTQEQIGRRHAGFKRLPVLYFSQLMGAAMGLDTSEYQLERHHVDPRPALARIPAGAATA
jgi:heterodisulfide reductase subunit B